MKKILIVDDELAIRKTLSEILARNNYKVETATDGKVCIEMVSKTAYDLILLGIKMPLVNGWDTFLKLSDIDPQIPIIIISEHGTAEEATTFVKQGAYSFISKPPDLKKLLGEVKSALESRKSSKKVKKFSKKRNAAIPQMIGQSEPMQLLKKRIMKVADSGSKVLITGPNGTGKELVALNVHHNSRRKNGPFVEVNCAAIPTELIESVLFGHEKGSFTGAHKATIGRFEQANGGTLFLDEIGDMSLSAQAKVLRVLEEGKITKVGGGKAISVDVRIIAATNKDLLEMIEAKLFRVDLYFRLAVIPIETPSLDERRSDIPDLIKHFATSYCRQESEPQKEFMPNAIKLLQGYQYQGNIRELRNIVERLIILGDNRVTSADVKKYVVSREQQKKLMMKRLIMQLGGAQEVIDFIEAEY